MKKKRYEYLPHTADVSFIAYGKTFESALENSAVALINLMLDVKKIEKIKAKDKEVEIKDTAANREDLVWYVLQDILSVIDSRKLNANGFKILESSEKKGGLRIKSVLMCKDVVGDFSLMSVKAVTPHGLEIRKNKSGYSISVVADV